MRRRNGSWEVGEVEIVFSSRHDAKSTKAEGSKHSGMVRAVNGEEGSGCPGSRSPISIIKCSLHGGEGKNHGH
jgi:hypothetical protein